MRAFQEPDATRASSSDPSRSRRSRMVFERCAFVGWLSLVYADSFSVAWCGAGVAGRRPRDRSATAVTASCPLQVRTLLSHGVALADGGATFQEPFGHSLEIGELDTIGRRRHERATTAGDDRDHEVVRSADSAGTSIRRVLSTPRSLGTGWSPGSVSIRSASTGWSMTTTPRPIHTVSLDAR